MSLPKESSLLQLFDLKVEQLDYAFVRECVDAKTLERIIRVLRSGQEGYYPHLLGFCEERLAEVSPRSRLLLTPRPPARPDNLPSTQLAALQEDLMTWAGDMRKQEEETAKYEVVRAPLPPVRAPAHSSAGHGNPRDSAHSRGEGRAPGLSDGQVEELLSQGRRQQREGDLLQASLLYQKVLSCRPAHPEARDALRDILQEPATLQPQPTTPLIQELD